MAKTKIKRTIRSGRLVKVAIYTPRTRWDSPRARAQKSKATTAARKAMNIKDSRSKLEFLIAGNFEAGDMFITLTYDDEHLPARWSEALSCVRGFLAGIREQRRHRGESMKYIYTTETKHGAGRFHHHVIMSATGRDIEIIRSMWPYGDVIDVEFIGQRDYETWAGYMTKESAEGKPVGAQSYTCSKGLVQPVTEWCYVDDDTALGAPIGSSIIEKEESVTEFGRFHYIKYLLPTETVRENRICGIRRGLISDLK